MTNHIIRTVCRAVLLLGFGSAEDQTGDRNKNVTNFANHKPLAAAVEKATKVVLYEGLPHPMGERKLYLAELKNQETKKLIGFRFYAKLLQLKEEDAMKLKALYIDPNSFNPGSPVRTEDTLFFSPGAAKSSLQLRLVYFRKSKSEVVEEDLLVVGRF